MTKYLLCFILFVSGITRMQGQSINDIMDKDSKIVWLGIDFTKLKIYDPENDKNGVPKVTDKEVREKYFESWNSLIIKEPKKYNVAAIVDRQMDDLTFHLEVTRKQNEKLDETVFVDNDFPLFTQEQIEEMLKHYDFQGSEGIGMMLIIEGFDKKEAKGYGWLVFVNMETKELILGSKYVGDAGGFGFRNYWAGALSKIILKAAQKSK